MKERVRPYGLLQKRRYLVVHNKAVQAHLESRERDSQVRIKKYRSFEDIKASKEHMVLQALSEKEREMLAACVLGTKTITVRDVTQSAEYRHLKNAGFVNRQHVLFEGLSAEEAESILKNNPSITEQDMNNENLGWQEALIYLHLHSLCKGGGNVQLTQDELVKGAFNGYFATSGGTLSKAINSLVARDLIATDKGVRPYKYSVPHEIEPVTIWDNIIPEDRDKAQEVGVHLKPKDIVDGLGDFPDFYDPLDNLEYTDFGDCEQLGEPLTLTVKNPNDDIKFEEADARQEYKVDPEVEEYLARQEYEDNLVAESYSGFPSNPGVKNTPLVVGTLTKFREKHKAAMANSLQVTPVTPGVTSDFVDKLVNTRLVAMNPAITRDTLEKGAVQASYDEATGTTSITFTLSRTGK